MRWKVSSMQLSQESETSRTGRSSVSLHCTRISLSGEYDRCTWVKKYMKRKKDYVTDSRSDSHNDRWVWDRIFTRGFLSHAGNTILDREIPVDACTALEINRILSVQPPRRDSWTMNVPGPCVEGETCRFWFSQRSWKRIGSWDFCLTFAPQLDFTVASRWHRVKARPA